MSKRDSLWARFKRIWEHPETLRVKRTSGGEEGNFCLRYKHIDIGNLSFKDGMWTFRYADNFRGSRFRTITEFPDVNKTYTSSELWPFFSMRIPSLRQADIRNIVARENIDEHDEAKLLKRFGRKTVANPFELVPFTLRTESPSA